MKKQIFTSLALILILMLYSCDNSGIQSEVNSNSSSEVAPLTSSPVITEVAPKLHNDGIYTISQSSGDYTASLALPSDGMMVFGNGYDKIVGQISNWVAESDYNQIDVFIPIGRDFNSYYILGNYDGQTHYDIVQTSSNGTMLTHPTGNTYYVTPSDGFSDFLIDYAVRAINAGATDVYFEEPDGFSIYACNDYVKSEWVKNYGEEWQDPSSSDNARYKSDKLVADIFTRAMDRVSSGIKKLKPNSKVYICTHSSLSYCSNPISANNYDITALPNIDGIVAQVWTNTSIASIGYDDERQVMPFEESYSEYSELLGIARQTGKKYYSLSDPAADNASFSLDYTRGIYQQNVVAQMLQPEINSFQISIWPDRSFGNADDNYQKVQQSVFAAMKECGTEKAIRTSGTTGVGIMMSYNAVSNENANQIKDYVNGISIPLLQQGIPSDVLLLESLSANTLENYKVIFVNYDYIKPEKIEENVILSDFVKKGGTLVCLGTGDKKSTLGFWSNEGYASPMSHLFSMISNSNLLKTQFSSAGKISKTNYCPSYFSEFTSDFSVNYADCSFDGETSYLTIDGKSILTGTSCEKGNVLVLGINSDNLLDSKDLRQLVVNITHFAIVLKGEEFISPKYLMTERGNYTAIKTYDTTMALKGKYINLFDETFTVLTDPIIENNSYGLYKKLSNDGIPRVFLANSANIVSQEKNNVLSFDMDVICGSYAVVIVSLPYVDYGEVIVKSTFDDSLIPFTAIFDEKSRTLKIEYKQISIYSSKITIELN